MDRNTLELHLRQARAHVAQGEKHIARQRAVVASLEAGGHDSEAARELLATFEDSQVMHVADVARLENELDRL